MLRRRSCGVLLLAIVIVALTACGRTDSLGTPSDQCTPPRPVIGGTTVRTLEHDGERRSYLVHQPVGYDGSIRTPVVMLFHGLGGNPAAIMRTTGMARLSDAKGFILVAPRGKGAIATWDFRTAASARGSDLGFVRALLTQVQADECVDPARTYAAGFSNGSAMTLALACDGSMPFAAYGGVSGTYVAEPCAPARPQSIIYFHGMRDKVIPYDGAETGIGPLPGVAETTSRWAVHDGCPASITTVSGHVRRTTWTRCNRGSAVDVYTVDNGVHGWPGGTNQSPGHNRGIMTRDVDGSALIWAFFSRHAREEP